MNYGDEKFHAQFQQAAAFAEEHQLGVYEICGAFEMALGDTQSESADDTGTTQQPADNVQAAPAPTPTPVPAPMPTPVPEPPAQSNCDPNYTPCIPAYPPDVNCGDIQVQVTGADPHGLDADNDGVGCESY